MPPSRAEASLPLKVQWGAHTSLAFAAPQKQPAGASTFFWHYKQQKCLFTVLRYDPSSPSWNYPERAGAGERAAPGSCFRLQVAGNTRTCSRPRTVGATSTSSHQKIGAGWCQVRNTADKCGSCWTCCWDGAGHVLCIRHVTTPGNAQRGQLWDAEHHGHRKWTEIKSTSWALKRLRSSESPLKKISIGEDNA